MVGLEPLQPFQGPRPTTGQAGWCLLLGVRHPVLRGLCSSHCGGGTARRVIYTCNSSALQCTCAMCIDRQDCANQPVGRCWRTVQHLARSCSNHLDSWGGVGCRAPWLCLLGVANPVVQSLTKFYVVNASYQHVSPRQRQLRRHRFSTPHQLASRWWMLNHEVLSWSFTNHWRGGAFPVGFPAFLCCVAAGPVHRNILNNSYQN